MPTLIANAQGASTGGSNRPGPVTSAAIDTTGASLLLAVSSDYCGVGNILGSGPLVADNKGNTWHLLTKYTCPDVNSQVTVWYASNPTVGPGHTATLTSGDNASGFLVAFSGIQLVSPFDGENGHGGDSVSSLLTGSVTPTQNGDLLFVASSTFSNTDVFSTDSSFVNGDFVNEVNAQHLGSYWSWKVQSLAATIDPTVSFGAGSQHVVVTIKAFKSNPEATLKAVQINTGAPGGPSLVTATGPTTQSGLGGFGPSVVTAGVYLLSQVPIPGFTMGAFVLTGIGGTLVGNMLTLTDGANCTVTATNTFIVLPLTIQCLPGFALANFPYDQSFSVGGGVPPYDLSIVAGSLPPGLTLNTSTGEVTGTPTTPGVFPYTVQVSDDNSPPSSTQVSCSMTVQAVEANPVGAFELIRVTCTMRPARHLPVRGSST